MKINRKFSALVIFMVMFFVVLLPLKNVSAQQSNDKLVPSQSIKTINEKESNQQITDNIFTQVKMFRTNGVEIKTSDIIPNGSPLKVSFQFSFTNKNYKKGDYFKTKIPQQINIASDLEGDFNPMTSAKWTIDAATNELTILFVEDNVKSETYDLDIVTALKKVNTSNESETKIIFDTTPQNTIYKLEYTSTIEDRGTSKIKVDGTFNQKTAQIESVYNLGRIIDNDRSFDVAIQMSGAQELWFSNLKVATSEVNFNGQLEGEKTQLQEGVDYDVTYVDINSNYPHAKVKLKKPLDRKALIINSQINNINNKNYSSPNNLDYGVIYAYARTMSGNTILTNIINSDYVYSGQPVMNSGKLNKETGNIDWTIYWNHNERDLNTTTFLRSFIGDQGLSYSENSLSINKVEVTRTSNGYSISEGSDITSQFNINMDTKGSFFMNPKSNISDALVIKYSTKNNDATKRDVTNAVTDGQNESEATVSTKPNLFEKENAEVDLYEQTMSWKITINKDRYNLKNAYVHDYFIDDVVDFTSLEVNKKSNGEEVVKLEEGKDYKLVVFDENGNPVGAKPNVNGAPDSFNGGVKVSFIGDYANLKDTLEININTKLDTKDFEKQIVKIKNVATLNYGDIPGVIVYEAEGDYNNPYYQGGAKLVKSSSDKQYYYQNWLIAVNVSGIKYNKVIIEDALPPGLELVSGSLRYDEIVSSECVVH
ncbi:MAG: hypothetical protein RR425_02655, partial [Erysipelotrichales bacterium]